MKLEHWLNQQGVSRKDFAARIGIDPISVGRYIGGSRRPLYDTLEKIMQETGGAVQATDFMRLT